ncbi:MAG TPA: tRNA (cytidine(34)-2'-O)-methyltransferase [Candidatus Binataceae bacterium]|nr:tRNA (cytidine(34)-2'-O)-methyltransferase [Candidatus Binataceae bacterium]
MSRPPFHIVLVRPEIPQNTGSIARLAAATQSRLHLVGPLGFSLEDRYLKRAGLDYWPLVDLRVYESWEEFAQRHNENAGSANFKFFSAHAEKRYVVAEFRQDDFLVFGSETKGLGREFLQPRQSSAYRIPIFEPGVRSLNLANAVSIAVYEALRQTGLLERGDR